MRLASTLLIATLMALVIAPCAQADEPAEVAATLEHFKATYGKWQAIEADLKAFDAKFQQAGFDEQLKLRQEFTRMIANYRAFVPKLQEAAVTAYKANPNGDAQVQQVLLGVTSDALNRDDYDTAKTNCDLLLANKCTEKGLNNLAGITAYCTDDFEKAETLLKAAEAEEITSARGQRYLEDVPTAKERFAKELELREKEAEAKDLPRVKIETEKGAIVIELFENEAPNTVANFINLVEKKYYDGLTFHRVLENFMAQGGCPKGTGVGGPGYNIPCECVKEEHRNHFRGTLSMAHAGLDTGGSQFFVTFLRTPGLDGKHTAFGRVVEGLDVLAKIQRRDPDRGGPAEKIIKAEVVRKRDHKYEPKTLPE